MTASAAMGLFESKLQPPWTRPGLVPRTALVDRLVESSAPIISVVAPAGYGKTTLLSHWSERTDRRSAWISLDDRDNDPAVLLSYVATALDRIEPIEADLKGSVLSPGYFAAARVVPLFGSLVASRTQPFSLILDHVEVLRDQRCHDAIAELAFNLAPGSRLAVASRMEPPLPMARLRAHGHVVELGADSLAMREAEARALLAGADVELSADELTELMRRTEGWPVGLYLAALAYRAGAPGVVGRPFGGDDRLMADYLRAEVLAGVPPDTLRFLRRTAVLETMSAPLCDAVLDETGSREVLESLERSNLLLVPLDRQRRWYRYHHLFRDLLRAELVATEPEVVDVLHERAATWLEAHGLPEVALDHAQAAADDGRAARLFATMALPTYAAGRVETVVRWLGWFEGKALMEDHPEIAVLGALGGSLVGSPENTDRWADMAEAGSLDGLLPDGSTLEAWVAFLGACLCRRGVPQMRADAELARKALAPDSRFQAPAAFFEGLSYLLEGRADEADAVLAESAEISLRTGAIPSAGAALAERAVVAIEGRDWFAAQTFAGRAVAITREAHLDDYLTSVVVHAVAARAAAHRGDVVVAREHLARAARLRPLCTYAFPASAQFLLQVAHAHLELHDAVGARAVLRQVQEILQRRPDMGTIPKQTEDLLAMADAMRSGSIGASSLTVAELRLLPYLTSHLSFREIGERMYLSRHTVKAQAMSVYRKFGVSSRSDAIAYAQEIGLLGA